MLTLFKQIFTWWNHQTLGTRLHTFFKGKFVGKDENGNKYYESKNGRRWVIYNGEVDSTKIPNEWFSWIHFTKNKIEKVRDHKKFSWQKSQFYFIFYRYTWFKLMISIILVKKLILEF